MIGHVAKVSTHVVAKDTRRNEVLPSEFEGHRPYFRLLLEESWVASPGFSVDLFLSLAPFGGLRFGFALNPTKPLLRMIRVQQLLSQFLSNSLISGSNCQP